MSPHAFVLNQEDPIPTRVYHRDAPNFGYKRDDEAYHLVEDDETAAYLRGRKKAGTPFFRHIHADRLEDTLETAESAVDAIETGDFDDVLDLLLFAEREAYGHRVTVIDAIADRQRELEEMRATDPDGDEGALAPEDVAPGVD